MAIREITYSEVEKALANTPEFRESMRDARFRPIFGNIVSSICDEAFKNCKNIVLREKLPQSISAVDTGAFQNCTSITHFSLPGIAYIGKNVFDGCTSLSAFDFTEDNLSIGHYAFASTALPVVRLPNTMDKVDECAFYDCSSLVSASGNNITSISHNAFYNCQSLSAVDFPKLKLIHRDAFTNTDFKHIDLSSVQQIDDGIFRNSKNLETVCLSNCISAGEYGSWEIFHGFYDDNIRFPVLREIKFPKITRLETGIAANLPELSNIVIGSLEELDTYGQFVSNCQRLSSLDLPSLKYFHGHYIAYNCRNLNNVNLQNLISSGGDRLFCECHSLSTISLPECTYSGDGVAWKCDSLNTINMPKLLDAYGPIAYDCSALTAITAPKLSSIGKFGLFDNCINVMSVYIDNDILHSINDGQIITPTSADSEWKWVSPKIDHVANDNIVELPAGDYAKNLRYVDCANAVNCYAEFSENKNLLYVNLPALSVADLNFDSCENLLSLDFSSAKYLFCNPDDMVGSARYLYGCVNLSAIKLSGDLRAIGYVIFNDTQLYKMQIASGKPIFEIDGGYCIKALDPTLSSYASPSIKLIGPEAWYNNGYELTAIDFPNCKYINYAAFCETAVQTAKLDNVKAIDEAAFSVTQLSSITCPKVEELGTAAFSYTYLSDLNIPMCRSIGIDAFDGSPLTSIYVANDVLHSIGNGYGLDNALIVNADETELVEFARGITHINNATISALRAESSIHSTELVDLQLSRLDCLDRTAIQQCTNLSTISLDSVTFMSHQSIYDCQNLSSISIPSIRELNYWAIFNCKNLLSIVMSSLTSVPDIVGGTQGPFYQLHPDYKVYVNADIRDTMANTGWWKTIADKIIAL